MWIDTDNWTWAGFLLFIARVAWAGAVVSLAIYTIMFLGQFFSEQFLITTQLPVTLEIHNLSEQFNTHLKAQEVSFVLDRVTTDVSILGGTSVSDLYLHIASAMKLAGYAIAVFVLSLIRKVLEPLTRGKPFQPKAGRNLYWIGGIIALITSVMFLYEWVVYRFLSQYPLPTNMSVHWPLPDYTYLIVGLIILSVAYVFNEGARMAREQKLTI